MDMNIRHAISFVHTCQPGSPLEINLDSTERYMELLTMQNLCARNLNAFTVLEEASPL
jgi:hypothetical protein